MVDNEIIKYLIAKFEEKIRDNPLTPEFVKLSNYYLVNGNINEAINLLQTGLTFYPNYTTAKLILAKCYLANRYFYDAKKIFEQILIEYPDMEIAKKFLDIANDLTKSEVSRKHDEDIFPVLDFKAPVFNDFDFNYNLFPSYEAADLINDKIDFNFDESNEYNEFKKIAETPHFFKRENSKPTFEKKRLKNKFEVKIITETLADIFAKQGNYFDAIEAYTYLLKTKPNRQEQIQSKISEVEIQIQKLINDF
ncbi:MAG: tetratricopeptide repeat protein [Ignavibacteriae bacterium]|nr:MAG: tetratricopeptide repeat protein [Ignavibacteriota bacterium]